MAPATATQVRRTLAVSGLSLAAVISARVLSRPQPEKPRRLIDWEAVARIGRARSADTATIAADDLAEQSALYDTIAHEVAPWMAEVCGEQVRNYPAFTAVDRGGFIDANLATMQRIMTPVEELRAGIPGTRLTELSRMASDRYIGEMFGLLARRVLGQYDPVLGGDRSQARPTLLMVEPNLRAFATSQKAPPIPLRRWIILHELTHAWQFGDHEWLPLHIDKLLNEVIDLGLEPVRGDSGVGLTRMPNMVAGQLRIFGRVQAVMTVLEGYATFLMNQAGRNHIPECRDLEKAHHRRGSDRSPLERLIFTLTGMQMKMRQYEVGEKFCVAVAERSSRETLNLMWSGPTTMPTLGELRNPDRWLKRVG